MFPKAALARDFVIERRLADQMKEENGIIAHFQIECDPKTDTASLHVYTYNPRSDATFLMGTFDNYDELENYMKTSRFSQHTYEVQWWSDAKRELQTSFFYARNIGDVLGRFTEIPVDKIHSIVCKADS